MAELTSLHLGKTMERKLHSVGILTAEDLVKTGSKEAALRLKAQYPSTCVVILYYLQAAIEGVEIKALTSETKSELRAFFGKL